MDRQQMMNARDLLAAYLVKQHPMELPQTYFDGTPIDTPKDMSIALGIPEWEAALRMGHKDVFTGSAGTQSVNVLSMSPSRRLARVNGGPKKRKKPKHVEADEPVEVVGRALSTRNTPTTPGTRKIYKR